MTWNRTFTSMPPEWRRPTTARFGIVVLFFTFWEIAARLWADPLFLSPPSGVFAAGAKILQENQVVEALLTTFWELAVAFVVSVVIGVIVGILVGGTRLSYRALFPLVLMAYAIPQITILPLFVLYFGPGPASKVAFGISHGVFPIIVNIVAGLRSVRPVLIVSARSMGANRWQLFRRILLPSMVPNLFTGMRLGMSATLLGVLLAELYVSIGGVGYLTGVYTESFQPHSLFALTGILALMAILLNETLRRAEVRQSRWR